MNTLTASQQEAINTDHHRVLVLAGPGSGKTQVTVERIRRLINDGADPRRIVALTFTNAAARELEERLDGVHLGHTGTLHSFAFRCLKRYGALLGYGAHLSVISPESASDLLETKARALGCKDPLKKLLEIKAAGIDCTKRLSVAETAVAAHLQELKEAGIVDFDVLLTEFAAFAESLGGHGIMFHEFDEFDYLFVDEVQDSSPIDWRIYRALPILHKFFVGDPDQAIYGFRGGSVSEMVREAWDTSVKVIRLEENFRSRIEICLAAQRLIEHNRNRVAKETRSTRDWSGSVMVYPEAANEGEEIAIVGRAITHLLDLLGFTADVPATDIAILARTNSIADAFQRTLKAWGIPVVERVKPDLPRDFALARATVELMANPSNDTLAYLYLKQRNKNAGEMIRQARAAGKSADDYWGLVFSNHPLAESVIGELNRAGASKECVMWVVEQLAKLPTGISVEDLALQLSRPDENAKEEGEGVHVLTIHAAKGREFRAVFVVGMEDETCPGHRKDTNEEEERRCLYVACTRAKDFLAVSFCRSRVTAWGEIVPMTPSRFISELTGQAIGGSSGT